MLQKAASLCLDLPQGGSWDWIHFHGRHAMERLTERTALMHGIQESSSTRGTSSHQQNPSVILCEPDCTESSGACIGAFLLYSGSFQTQIEVDQLRQTRLVMGLHPDLFQWTLQPNDTFATPEAVLSYSSSGLAQLSHHFHQVIREHICRGTYQLAERPILINSWEAAYFDFDDQKLLKIAKEAASIGVDMLVLDDGWFGKRDDDCSGLGDWFVNEKKLNGSLCHLVEQVKAMGLKFGIWFEPEMVSEDSDLYRAHPEWSIQIPGRKPTRSRYQLLLDLSRSDVQDYLYERISAILKEADISYIKWDMNRSICDWYTTLLPADQQGELPHRYILGLYALLERLTTDFPEVLFEDAAAAAADLMPECCTIVRRSGAAMIQMLTSARKSSTVLPSFIPFPQLVLTFPLSPITRPAELPPWKPEGSQQWPAALGWNWIWKSFLRRKRQKLLHKSKISAPMAR